MAAVRARRPGKRGGGEPPHRGKRRPAPVPAYESMPRIARIKLSGGLAPEDVQVSGKSLALALTGGVMFIGIAIAGAAWLGSSLFDAREAFDARAVEAQSFGEDFFAQFADGTREVLPGAEGVDKFYVDHFGPLFTGHFQYALGCTHVVLVIFLLVVMRSRRRRRCCHGAGVTA